MKQPMIVPTIIRRRKSKPAETPPEKISPEKPKEGEGYLCITRRPVPQQDTIYIDGKIEVKVISIKGNSVRLGVKTVRSIPIRRGEVAS